MLDLDATSYTDNEGAWRTFLRQEPHITALIAQRTFFGIPDNATFPLITVRDTLTDDLPGEAPIASSLLQFECWGEGRNKAQAELLKRTLVAVLESLECGDLIADGVRVHGVSNISSRPLNDPLTDQARYIVTASFSAVPDL